MSSLYTEKIRQNADLLVPISECPLGDPITECPFIPYYAMKDERKQMEQVEAIPQKELDELRKFHRACMAKYRSGEWKPTNPKRKAM
ncbi:MAG: hypothetical protein PHP53_15460 [Prolixibacteraceae bacterium]|nr:hypothetical protein [Prolixibacteraceae bacterium]